MTMFVDVYSYKCLLRSEFGGDYWEDMVALHVRLGIGFKISYTDCSTIPFRCPLYTYTEIQYGIMTRALVSKEQLWVGRGVSVHVHYFELIPTQKILISEALLKTSFTNAINNIVITIFAPRLTMIVLVFMYLQNNMR